MDDFKAKYEQELIYQEIKSNRYTLKGSFVFLLALTFIWLLTMAGVFDVNKTLMNFAFAATVILLLPARYILWKADLSKRWIKYFLLSLVCIVAAVISSFLSFHAVFAYVLPLLFAVQYRRRRTIWFVYVINTVTMAVSMVAAFYYGICDLNLLLESQHVRSWYLENLRDGMLNVPFNENPVFVILMFGVFPRSIILGVFSVMMQYAVINSNEDAFRIAKLTYLKDTDTRTKVYNKNKYEEMSAEYYPQIDEVAVVFCDLNNLKQINDKYGHAMGDKAIEKLSMALYQFWDDRHKVYRVGGDEFLLVVDNPKSGEAEHIVEVVKNDVSAGRGEHVVKISTAIGYAVGRGRDIERLTRNADENMYTDKKHCKEKE